MSFCESFWTGDYESGYLVLFAELNEGIKENLDFISLFTRRAEIEAVYGLQLEAFPSTLKRSSARHSDVDYVSTIKNAFEEGSANFERQGAYHLQIAGTIQETVIEPFSKWSSEHEERVNYSELVIRDKYKQFVAAKGALDKLQKRYFNKCRVVEEFKSKFDEEELQEALEDSSVAELSALKVHDGEDSPSADLQVYTLGESKFDSKSIKQFLTDILSNVELTSHKVPILGTYYNVSTGSAITQWMLDNMPELRGNIGKAELCGQGLLTNGFLRSVGYVGASKNFINSSQFFYQWKPCVFEITQISEFDISNSGKSANYDPVLALANRNTNIAHYFEDVKQAMGVNSVDYSDRSQYPRHLKEVELLDVQYFESTRNLDAIRCELEELIMDHYTFMQKCELDRLRAIKKAMFDFVSAFASQVPAMKQTFDSLSLIEETIRPARDLKFLVENYATGHFRPHVFLYDNYYNSNINQTFGVDLSVKARFDKRAVPVLVQTVLSYLDSVYPDLDDDEERVNLWTHPVHLSSVHKLRSQLNGLADPAQILEAIKQSEPTTVVNALKLYFLELPDSIVPNSYFDLIRTLYQNYPVGSEDENSNKSRITGLQNSLIDLPVCNLATLDAILTHLSRLVVIISSKNEKLSTSLKHRLCREFGSLVLGPKKEDAAMNGKSVFTFKMALEQLEQNFVADLFDHKESIFGELRRRNSMRPQRSESQKSAKLGKEQSSFLSPKTSTVQHSQSRLESRLKSAVLQIEKKPPLKIEPEEAKRNPVSELKEQSFSDSARRSLDPATPERPPVPSKLEQSTPKTPQHTSLKRSISPSKKKGLNTYLDRKPSGTGSIVSSAPAQKDVIVGDSDFARPQFKPQLERKTSVKDMASSFEAEHSFDKE